MFEITTSSKRLLSLSAAVFCTLTACKKPISSSPDLSHTILERDDKVFVQGANESLNKALGKASWKEYVDPKSGLVFAIYRHSKHDFQILDFRNRDRFTFSGYTVMSVERFVPYSAGGTNDYVAISKSTPCAHLFEALKTALLAGKLE